jgi:hypothetical protein
MDMSIPKLHHYVPRFYLNNFVDSNKQFWVWNKDSENVFKGNPYGVAAENHFYRIPEFVGTETDPLFLERNLAHLEGKVARILKDWFERLDKLSPMEELDIDEETRHTISYFIAVQFFRTAEQRDILTLFAETKGGYVGPISPDEKSNLHAYFLCTSELVFNVTSRIEQSIWMFGRNNSEVPFWTSDNPICFKTGDNKMWLKGPGIMSEGTYAVYPLSPKYVLYCKEPTFWNGIKIMNNKLSPVEFDSDMVEHENAGQVFSAKRFVISAEDEFSFAREFVKTIGTNIYAPDTANE